MTTTLKKKKPAVKKIKSIFVRDLKDKDFTMLAELKKITGYKSATRNVMHASHQYLEGVKEIATHKATIESLKGSLESVTQEYRAYKTGVQNFMKERVSYLAQELQRDVAQASRELQNTISGLGHDLKHLDTASKQYFLSKDIVKSRKKRKTKK